MHDQNTKVNCFFVYQQEIKNAIQNIDGLCYSLHLECRLKASVKGLVLRLVLMEGMETLRGGLLGGLQVTEAVPSKGSVRLWSLLLLPGQTVVLHHHALLPRGAASVQAPKQQGRFIIDRSLQNCEMKYTLLFIS